MLRAKIMSNEDEDSGGIVLGGISFGVGPAKEPAGGGKAPPDEAKKAPSGPVEVDNAMLPLRVTVVGDFVPSAQFNAGANPPEHPIPIDPTAFDELFRKLAPRIALEVESVLAEGGKVRVDIAPGNMKSFRPDGLVADIPLLRSLLDGKRVLEQLRDGTIGVDGATTELNRLWNGSALVAKVLGGVQTKAQASPAAPAAPAPAANDDAMARILDMVDTGTTSDADSVAAAAPAPVAAPAPPTTGKGRFDKFISAVAHSGKSGKPGANPAQAIRTVEKAVGLQLGAILQHPELRRLEQAWRGLHLLASRTPKSGVRLEVISARPDDFPAALQRAVDANYGIDPPVSFAVVDGQVEGDAASFARLRALADVAEQNTVPVLTNASAGLFGREDLEDIDRLDNKKALFEAPERAPWRSEAHRPAMLWVSMVMNRVLARPAYDPRATRIREAQIQELPGEKDAEVWLNPAWAVASLAMRSFDKYEWPCGITGVKDGGMIENLPVREIELASGERIAIPLEVFFSTETQRALGRLGVLALASQPNTDEAYLLTSSTAYVTPPKKTYDSASTEPEMRLPQASLVDQLFVARLAQFLQALGSRISADSNPAEVEPVLNAALHELFRVAPPPGPEIKLELRVGDRGMAAQVTIRPRRFLGVGMEEITLGVPLG